MKKILFLFNACVFAYILGFFAVPLSASESVVFDRDPKKSHQVLDAEEVEALKIWGNRHRGAMGPLLNPPAGTPRRESRVALDYLRNLLEEIGGEGLKQRKIKVVLQLYMGDTPNAFMARHRANKELQPHMRYDHPEANWKYRLQKDGLWPIRRYLGLRNGQHFYEIAFSTNLLQIAETRDALAFVGAHELVHLFERHVEPADSGNGRFKRWWSSQHYEAVADHEALKLIIGKYELDAAIEIMNRFLKKEDGKSWRDYIAGLKAHHHPGVRLGLLQAAIEYFRRTDAEAHPREKVDLPQNVKVLRAGRGYAFSQEFEDIKDLYHTIAIDYFLAGKYGSTTELHDLDYDKKDAPQVFVDFYNKFDGVVGYDQAWEAFIKAYKEIVNSSKSKQRKLDAILRLIMFTDYQVGPIEHFKGKLFQSHDPHLMTYDDVNSAGAPIRRRFSQDFAELALGRSRWQAEVFLANMRRLDGKSSKYTLEFWEKNPFLAQMMRHLHDTVPEWRKFFEALPGVALDPKNTNRPSDFTLGTYINCFIKLAGSEDNRSNARGPGPLGGYLVPVRNPLREQMQGYFFDHLQSLDLDAIIINGESKGRRASITDFFEGVSSLEESEFESPYKEKVLAYLSSYKNHFLNAHVEHAKKLADRSIDNFDKSVIFSDYYRYYRKVHEFSEHNRELQETMIDFAKSCTEEKPMGWGIGHISRDMAPSWANYIDNPEIDMANRLRMLKFVSASTSYLVSLKRSQEDDVSMEEQNWKDTARESFTGLLASLNPNEFVDYLGSGVLALHKLTTSGDNLARYHELKPRYWELKKDDHSFVSAMDESLKMEVQFYFNILGYLGAELEVSDDYSARFSFDQLKQIINLYFLYTRTAAQNQNIDPQAYRKKMFDYFKPSDTAIFLYDIFSKTWDEASNANEWKRTYKRILRMSHFTLEMRVGLQEKTENFLRTQVFPKLSPEEIYNGWVKDGLIRRALSQSTLATLMTDHVLAQGVDPLKDVQAAQKCIRVVERDLRLAEKNPELRERFRKEFAERTRLQPQHIEAIFPTNSGKSTTQMTRAAASPIRGLSAMVAISQREAIAEQLKLLDYLMGRRASFPAFIDGYVDVLEGDAPVANLLMLAKERMAIATLTERVLVVNSFLSGPNGPSATEKGTQEIVDSLLTGVEPKDRKLAHHIASSLLGAQGAGKELALSYVMAHKSKERSDGMLSETEVLKALFSAHGVPGIKLAQYLAFMDEFQVYKDAFASFQDDALPLDYLESVELIKNNYDWNEWPYKRVLGPIGSGAVNVAIEIQDTRTGEYEALVLLRENIRLETEDSFRKFDRFLDHFLKDPEYAKRFGYLRGLSKIIRMSVELEFNKEEVFRLTKQVQQYYNREIAGWKYQAVDVNSLAEDGIFMQKGLGQTARRVFEQNPTVYREAMRGLSQIEIDLLLGIDGSGSTRPVPLFANPDFHDGQVLIDEKTKTVRILDFGQAVPLSNSERELGVTILAVLGRKWSVQKAYEKLNQELLSHVGSSKQPSVSSSGINETEFAKLYGEKTDRMDFFIKLLGHFSNQGMEPPIGTIHWVMGIHRQDVLGRKVGLPNHKSIRNLVVSRMLNVSIGVYNRFRVDHRRIKELMGKCGKILSQAGQ